MEYISSHDGTAIALEATGDGAALIVIAGALCDRRANYAIAEALAPHFTVYNYDRRGRGDSGNSHSYSVEREVQDLKVLLRRAGGEAFVLGFSSGAALALEAALHGLPFRRVALWEPPYADGPEMVRPNGYVEQLADLLARGARGDAVEYFLTVSAGVPKEMVSGMRSSPMWSGMEELAHTLRYDALVMGDGSVPRDRVSELDVETLAASGGDSPAWIRETAAAIAAAAPRGRAETIQGQDHDVEAAALAPVVREFFGR